MGSENDEASSGVFRVNVCCLASYLGFVIDPCYSIPSLFNDVLHFLSLSTFVS